MRCTSSGAATFEALSGNPVTTDVWSDVPEVAHVRIGQNADLVVVAPATADLLARAAMGRADDLLTATLLTASCPVRVRRRRCTPRCGCTRPPRRTSPPCAAAAPSCCRRPSAGSPAPTPAPAGCPSPPTSRRSPAWCSSTAPARWPHDLAGRRVVISAGGTREPLDPVRYLGNRSSGKQGWALARVAAARGAEVVLVAANVELPAPFGVRVVPVGTAEELRTAMLAEAPEADVVVMAAAVADFRPATESPPPS